jgi:hypothetical protein
MSQSVASIRANIVNSLGELDGFTLSLQSPDYFGRTQNTIAHKAFTVQCLTSTATEDKQRRAVGLYINTQYRLMFAYRLRPQDIYPTDYDNALNTESNVINSVMSVYSSNNKFTLNYVGSERVVTDSQEYIIISIDFIAKHTI